MASLFPAFLFIFAIFPPQFITGDMAPFCSSNTNKYYGPKLPTFPEAFEASVEVNIVDRNYSAVYTEYYDKKANKGALRKVKNGTSTYFIYNYNENEVMVIHEGSRNCSLQNISDMHHHAFFGRNGSRIEGMADLFRFGASFNETFMGNDTVRGIPCFHWQTCINHHNHSYLLDYYFSIPDWTMPHGSGMQVVRATIKGTTTLPYHSRARLPENSTRSFYHVYDFFSFKPGPPPPSAFDLPRGVFCAGMKDRKPLPEMKSVFSVEIERLNMVNKSVFYMKEYYDVDRNMAMFKFYDHRHRGYGETRLIHDFTHGVIYNISGSVCQNVTILSLNNTWDAKETADHHIRMKTSSEMVFSNNKSAMIYTGSTTVRGIDADVWIIKKEVWRRVGYKHEITNEFYFSKKPWNMRAGSLNNQSQVLLRIDTYDLVTHKSTRMNIINYDAESVPLSVFNINPCFVNNRAIISIKLKGDIKTEVFQYETQFNVGIRNSVAKAAGVSNLRVDNVWNGKSSEFIQIWFTLLGNPPVMSPDAKKENNLTEAIEVLRKTVEKGELEIIWNIPGKGKLTKKAEKFFYDSMDVDKPTSSPVSPTGDHGGKKGRKKGGVPGGAVAGIAFLMIAIGICFGLGIAHIMMKRRGTSLFQYQRQE